MKILYETVNIFFFAFHIGLIFFNLFGWIFPKLRKWNLATLGLTAFSWFALGIFYGWGYCILTDWHWAVRERIGLATQSDSYIHFLITAVLPVTISEKLIDVVTAVLFFAACLASLIANFVILKKH